mgnify:CR=1 FL=1
MVFQHVWGLFTNPKREWVAIRDDECTIGKCYAVHVLILAAIPAISGFIGTTQFGWQIGAGDPVKLTLESAGLIAVLYYMAMLVGVFSLGWMIHWMGGTYGADVQLSQCVVLAAYTATPLFLIGLMELYPVLWLNMVVGIPALAYTVYLLYTGVPVMMGISEERGFLFSSAVLAVGLVAFVYGVIVLLGGLTGARNFNDPLHGSRLLGSTTPVVMSATGGELGLYDEASQEIRILVCHNMGKDYVGTRIALGEGAMGLNPADNPIRVSVIVWPWGKYLGEEGMERGIRAKVSTFTRHFVNAKMTKGKTCGDYVNSILAKRESLLDGYDEAIMLDTQGLVSEASGENLFTVRDGAIRTRAFE